MPNTVSTSSPNNISTCEEMIFNKDLKNTIKNREGKKNQQQAKKRKIAGHNNSNEYSNNNSTKEKQNRFSILSERDIDKDNYQQMETEELEDDDTNIRDKFNNTNSSSKEQNNDKPGNSSAMKKDKSFCPPIFIVGLSVKDIQNNLKNVPSNVRFKYVNLNGGRIKLFVDDIKFHKKLINELRNLGVQAYSFTPKEERKTSLLLKGIDHNFTSTEVAEALLAETSNDIEFLKVAPFETNKSKKENRPLNMFIVQMKNYTDINKVIRIKYLLHQKITWDKLRNNNTIRCYRCQRFGHGSEYCTSTIVCVFCSGNHDVSDCPEILNKKNESAVIIPTCANCKQAHTASYKGCPGYINYVQKRAVLQQKAKEATSSRKRFISNTVNNYVRGNITFAEMAKSGIRNNNSKNVFRDNKVTDSEKNFNTDSNNCFVSFMNEAKSLFNRSFTELLREIRQFWPKYLAINSEEEKMKAYLQFLASIAI